MRKSRQSWILASLALMGAGCVSQGRYDELVTKYQSEMQARKQYEDEMERSQGAIGDMQSQLREKDEAFTQLQSTSEQDKARIAELQKALTDAQSRSSEMGEGVEVFGTASGFAYRIADQLLFDPGSTAIRDAGKKALVAIAKEIVEKGYTNVRIDGHTDADPVVKTKAKWPLGNHELALARALAVFAVLTKDGKAAESIFTIAGYGPNHPVAKGETDGAKSKNRRVEIHVAVPSKT